jgi:hypothetical protein
MLSGGTLPREPAKSGEEQDVLSRYARSIYKYTQRPRVCSKVKRAVRRRERHKMLDGYDGF